MELAAGVYYPSALCFWSEHEDQACFVPLLWFQSLNVPSASEFRIIWEDLEGIGRGATIIGILFMKKPFRLKSNKKKKKQNKKNDLSKLSSKVRSPCYLRVFEHSKLPFCHRLMLVFTLLSPDKKQFKREMIYCVS